MHTDDNDIKNDGFENEFDPESEFNNQEEFDPEKEFNIENNNDEEVDENFYGYNNQDNNDEQTSNNKSKKIKILIIILVLLLLIGLGVLAFVLIRNNNTNNNKNPNNGGEVIDPAKIPNLILLTEKLELKVGESKKIEYKIENDDGNVVISWSSAGTSIATVSSKGVVKGVKAGSIKVVASYTFNGVKYEKVCNVKVINSTEDKPVVDTVKPTLSYTITTGKENAWTNMDVSIKTTATDNSGSVTVKYTTNCTSNCKYINVTNNLIKINTLGTSVVSIVATDKTGNSVQKDVVVKIDKTKPTCSLKVSESGVLSATYKDTGGSDMNYYGFSSSYTGTTGNIQNLSKAGTYIYYVKDKAGNTNTCSLPVKAKTQYKYQDCTKCLTCNKTGCKTYTDWLASGGWIDQGDLKSGQVMDLIKYYCTNGKCLKSVRKCSDCDKCGGCDTWGTESSWVDSVVESATRKISETRTYYYS